jgi:hypothetical protein
MTIDYQFGYADAHDALIHARAAPLATERRSSVRDVLAAGDFWGAGPSAPTESLPSAVAISGRYTSKPTPTN